MHCSMMDSNMKSVLRSYLNKCGDGRGLEKFLRRNSYSSDSSTRENSIPLTTKSRNKTKSLESLTDKKDDKHASKRSLKEAKSPAKEEVSKSAENLPEKSMEHAKVIVKQSGEKIDKKKSQFNYESIIEITLPAPAVPLPPILDNKSQSEEKLEEPITPILCVPAKPKIPSHNNAVDISPSSAQSCVSNKQNPLEWDSFLPGFDSSPTQQNFQLCNPMELGDSELKALKTYFQRIGLQLPNENLVVVIKNKQESTAEREKQFNEIKRNKEKWQNIYEKYKEKYQQRSFKPEAQSTPNVTEPATSKMTEKSSQTSLIKNTARSTQVEVPVKVKSSKECQVTVDKGSLSSRHSQENQEIYQNQSEIAESFEFIAGSMQKQRSETSSERSKVVEASEVTSESSVKNDDISNFDDSLKVAIALLSSLLESRHMKPELKRNLAGKVIQKIVQIQTSRSIQTSTLGSSGIYPISNSSEAQSVKETSVKSEASKAASGRTEASKETSIRSEASKATSGRTEASRSSGRSRDDVLKDCFKPMTKSEVDYQQSIDEPTKGSTNTKSVPKSQLMDYVKREKESHLKWLEKEIEHLRNLRDLLKRNDTPIQMDENCPIYANLSSLLEEKEKLSEKLPFPPPWNSHGNSKKSRSKLETPELPVHEESLATFIDNKNRKFVEKYGKSRKQYEDTNVYTRPYSANHKKVSEIVKPRKVQATKDVQTSTSLASSSVFESSDSISVPVNTNTKTSTTLYQSENFSGKTKKIHKTKSKIAETQTTDSICRTNPIFESKTRLSDVKFGTSSTTVTQRINRMMNDKQQQTHPPSIKYTLTFDKQSRTNIREFFSLPQKGNSEYAAISKSSKDIFNQISSVATLDNRRSSEDKENFDADTIIDDDDEIDLQSCLNQKRPDIFTKFEERKRCILELKKLRALRNEHRKKLLLLTSDKSLEGKLFASLPELPLRTKRMFSTKALKLQTQRKVQSLTEVQNKKKEENLKNLKRKNRLMTEIFNKNLQRNVLKGNLNLSNTVNLISK